jgi:hypothetical protein
MDDDRELKDVRCGTEARRTEREGLRLLEEGLIRIELKLPFSDGTVLVDMDPLSLCTQR